MYCERRNDLINKLSAAGVPFNLGMNTEELEQLAKENDISCKMKAKKIGAGKVAKPQPAEEPSSGAVDEASIATLQEAYELKTGKKTKSVNRKWLESRLK